MNFDFDDDQKLLQDQARRFLAERSPRAAARRVLDGGDPIDRDLWRGIAELGWPGIAVPENLGGTGMGYEGLCLLALELGRALAPVPFSSSVYLAAEAVLRCGEAAVRQAAVPRLASGAAIGTLALAEGLGDPRPESIKARVAGGRLTGTKTPVPDGSVADLAVVAARDEADAVSLFLVDLDRPGVARTTLKCLDPSRDLATLVFDGAEALPLGPAGRGWPAIRGVLDRAAVLFAFEQIGGAEAALDDARAYALERYAFGRPIGSFQALKHKLADVYVANELARSNAYYAAWALATDAPDLPAAAAAARVAASDAFWRAARDNLHVHGGMGFTWQADCHLYYRRAKLLSGVVGSPMHWRNRLIDELELTQRAS